MTHRIFVIGKNSELSPTAFQDAAGPLWGCRPITPAARRLHRDFDSGDKPGCAGGASTPSVPVLSPFKVRGEDSRPWWLVPLLLIFTFGFWGLIIWGMRQ